MAHIQYVLRDNPFIIPMSRVRVFCGACADWSSVDRLSTNGWNGHSLTVTLSLASEPTKPIAGPTKSPSLSGMPYASGFSAPPVTSAPMGASPACVPNQE